jgi:arginine repressor
MKRRERLNFIQEIVSKQSISTQRELQRILELAGVTTSQTCLSHDLHELKIKKNVHEFWGLWLEQILYF